THRTLTCRVPHTDGMPGSPPSSKGLAPQTERGSGTVLIAEDERALRRLSATVLGQAGDDTLEARDGQRALDLFTVHSGKIVMVVTDVVMPRIGGIELAERLRQSRPNLPILFVTGYVEQRDALPGSAGGTAGRPKPS